MWNKVASVTEAPVKGRQEIHPQDRNKLISLSRNNEFFLFKDQIDSKYKLYRLHCDKLALANAQS